LHFLSRRFATIEVEDRVEVRNQAEPREPKAIRFRSERFWTAKTALMDRLYLRDGDHIRIIFSDLQTMSGAGMVPLPPHPCETVKL
jgi:hypothetical protein